MGKPKHLKTFRQKMVTAADIYWVSIQDVKDILSKKS
jgi:hypothetical protein